MLNGDHALIKFLHQLMLMRNHHHGGAHIVDGLQQFHHFFGKFGVNVAGRLVGDDQLGAVHHGTGQRHTLLLAARKLFGQAVGLFF